MRVVRFNPYPKGRNDEKDRPRVKDGKVLVPMPPAGNVLVSVGDFLTCLYISVRKGHSEYIFFLNGVEVEWKDLDDDMRFKHRIAIGWRSKFGLSYKDPTYYLMEALDTF